jgi:hypothetical protein
MAPPDDKLERRRQALAREYEELYGQPVSHFFCPLMQTDKPGELCKAHVINKSIKGTGNKWVVQRQDIDNFYGEKFEGEFVDFVHISEQGLGGLFRKDEAESATELKVRKKLVPFITADDEPVPYHPYRPRQHVAPGHSPFELVDGSGGSAKFVLHKPRHEIDESKKWRIGIEQDARLVALVSIIKSAFLGAFYILGYRYTNSACGKFVGYDILGEFFRQHRVTARHHFPEAARCFFNPFIHMMRPIAGFGGEPPIGTVHDNRAMLCFASDGQPFAMIFTVKTGHLIHAVLMPAFGTADSAAAYHAFLTNKNEDLYGYHARYEGGLWVYESDPVRQVWSKEGASLVD